MTKKLLILLLPLLLVSCVTSKRVNLMQEPGKHKIPAYADTLTYEDYQVRVGDRLYVYVYSIDERISKMFNPSGAGVNSSQIRQSANSGGSYDLYTYLVLDDGTIDYPMVGRVPVRGKTTREIKLDLERELSGYVS
jgi:polysaccharide export outer membrane protein